LGLGRRGNLLKPARHRGHDCSCGAEHLRGGNYKAGVFFCVSKRLRLLVGHLCSFLSAFEQRPVCAVVGSILLYRKSSRAIASVYNYHSHSLAIFFANT